MAKTFKRRETFAISVSTEVKNKSIENKSRNGFLFALKNRITKTNMRLSPESFRFRLVKISFLDIQIIT
ncbi:hypothetical protein LEP1GSC120_1376 [Leptospira santarosai str. 200702252]|nr:hypothetical protein LEP1GSC130_0278 [Leptospira santarosai str. 200403458]EMO98005.1 hypothetical protein LEP1GSC120_1376 [Leptospira santarosai str. 200702252]